MNQCIVLCVSAHDQYALGPFADEDEAYEAKLDEAQLHEDRDQTYEMTVIPLRNLVEAA